MDVTFPGAGGPRAFRLHIKAPDLAAKGAPTSYEWALGPAPTGARVSRVHLNLVAAFNNGDSSLRATLALGVGGGYPPTQNVGNVIIPGGVPLAASDSPSLGDTDASAGAPGPWAVGSDVGGQPLTLRIATSGSPLAGVVVGELYAEVTLDLPTVVDVGP